MGKAARELGLTDRIMALRMKKYGITYKEFRLKTVPPLEKLSAASRKNLHKCRFYDYPSPRRFQNSIPNILK